MPTVALTTLGCKLNSAETLSLGKEFLMRGYRLVEFGTSADVAVINTCTVTERADRECRQLIRRARRASPEGVLIVTGCYAQLNPDRLVEMREVDYILGAKEKSSLFTLIGPLERALYPQVFVSRIDQVDNFGPASSTEAGDRTRAFLKVQDGCDYRCSFCTIPLARGASRSQSIDACVDQARALVGQGYREIVLTGVNVGDYGTKDGSSLLALLGALVRIDGLARLRISSIEPNLLTDAIIDFVASEPVMCRHFHVPLQSGSDETLRRMRRRYTSAFYAERVHAVRERIPDCGIGVDVITGFPGETDAHFAETLSFLHTLPVSYLHVFTYSERPHTPAASFGSPVPPAVRRRRTEQLRLVGMKKRGAFHEGLVGSIVQVLFESAADDGIRRGFTGTYARVAVPADAAGANSIVNVVVTGAGDEQCTGRVLQEEVA